MARAGEKSKRKTPKLKIVKDGFYVRIKRCQ